jgi:beta-glucosidase-like glycosyl hydrolase
LKEESLEISSQKPELQLVQITEKLIEQEVRRILEKKSKYVKANRVKRNSGWK